ncbi:hypothetical protein V1522DRAFT_175992 [Lipomyces starkeyi]
MGYHQRSVRPGKRGKPSLGGTRPDRTDYMYRKYLERKAAREAARAGARSRVVTADVIVDEARRISDSEILSENYKIGVLHMGILSLRELPQLPRERELRRLAMISRETWRTGEVPRLEESAVHAVPFVGQFLEDCRAYLRTKSFPSGKITMPALTRQAFCDRYISPFRGQFGSLREKTPEAWLADKSTVNAEIKFVARSVGFKLEGLRHPKQTSTSYDDKMLLRTMVIGKCITTPVRFAHWRILFDDRTWNADEATHTWNAVEALFVELQQRS